MGSEGSAQLGGNLSTNAGGLAVLRYGTARDLVLGLEVVLPNGEVLSELKGLRKDNTGYDLKALFLGAEGTLGVITAAVLKLFPEPRTRATAWLAVRDLAAACRLLGRARRESGDQVVSAEYVSRRVARARARARRRRTRSARRGSRALRAAGARVGRRSRRAAREARACPRQPGWNDGEVLDGTLAESEAQRAALWRLRERVPEAERRNGGSVKHDVAVRISSIPQFVELAEPALSAIAPHRLSIYGHIGDGNLHFNLLPPDGQSIDRVSRRPRDAAVGLRARSRGESRRQLQRRARGWASEGGRARALRVARGACDDACVQSGARSHRHHESGEGAARQGLELASAARGAGTSRPGASPVEA